MCRTCKSNHSLENEKPLFLTEYCEQTVSIGLVIATIIVRNECLKILTILFGVECVFDLKIEHEFSLDHEKQNETQ